MVSIKGIIGNNEGEVNLISVVEQVQKEQGEIHVLIDSIGGDLDVGTDIYNYLKALPNKVITECVNNCASSASVVLLAGDERIIGCPVMIHNPWMEVTGNAEELKMSGEWLESKEKELEKLYSSITSLDSETLSKFMDNESYLSPSQAVAFGFGTLAKNIVQARLSKPNINKKEEEMSKNNSFLATVLAKLSGTKPDAKTVVYNLELSTADGGTIQLEKEEGEPQVGDNATPDGTHVMPDGVTIVIQDGKIASITEPQSQAQNKEGDTFTKAEVETLVEALATDSEAKIQALEEQVKTLTAQAKTKEDLAVLNKVKIAGGVEKVFGKIASNHQPAGRVQKPTSTGSSLAMALDSQKTDLEEKYENYKKGAGNE